jgi:2'-5' RNA ligase
MKAGIIVMAELSGAAAASIGAMQARFDPRMARELPPHVTITGSSGMGPIPANTPLGELSAALNPIAGTTVPFDVTFGAPFQFMQSPVVVLPIDPHGPIRDLHERIRASGLSYEEPRFTFTPHCTLSFYPELPPPRLRELLRFRYADPVRIDAIQVYRATDTTASSRVQTFSLTGSLRR